MADRKYYFVNYKQNEKLLMSARFSIVAKWKKKLKFDRD